MVFSSYTFLFLFLPSVLLVYYGMPMRARALLTMRTLWLTVASYVFYGWSGGDLCLLILLSTSIDLVCAWGIAGSKRLVWRRSLLTLSVVTNLGLLAAFKYGDFGMRVLREVLHSQALPVELGAADLMLPVGISFYTFQSMSYTIDVYRGRQQPVAVGRTLDFFCYVALFPQLVAGPIVRYRQIGPQIAARQHRLDDFARGCFYVALGLAKKVLIADSLTGLIRSAYSMPEPGLLDSWCSALAVAIGIYFDFSGYSDMAIGLGLMFGFVLPQSQNFSAPYRADSVTTLWRRFHMTLTAWLRDYPYAALGGQRRGRLRGYFNLAATMIVCGLWHGASWGFFVWGVYNGLLLVGERALGTQPYAWLPRPVRVALTFTLWLFGAGMFGAADSSELVAMLSGMVGAHGIGGFRACLPRDPTYALCVLAVATSIVFVCPTTLELARRLTWTRIAWAVTCLLPAVWQLLSYGFQPFVYFRF